MTFTRALVRPPASSFAAGITSADEGAPDLRLARLQHRDYCRALADCGLELTVLPAVEAFPDGTFVEDTAIVTERGAIALNPGAPSRQGEVESVVAALASHYEKIARIEAPGTVDGGDVCDADGHFLIGLSSRTNEEGARQLAACLAEFQYTSSIVDIRGSRLLHLKSGIAYIGDERLVVTEDLPKFPAFRLYERIPVRSDERYAANCIRVNDRVLVADGYPRITDMLLARRCRVVQLDMSEFRKMDGGLSCLSLRL